jgi:hypothetical protein
MQSASVKMMPAGTVVLLLGCFPASIIAQLHNSMIK